MYFITTLFLERIEQNSTEETPIFNYNEKRSRCIGYYNNYDSALEVVQNNLCDIYEWGHYNFVVIEEVKEGVYQYDDHPIWFAVSFNAKNNTYKVKKTKNPFPNICGFGIG